MFSDKISYNAPIPGEEFRKRDLSVPAEAAKVVYEIDSQHGEDKDLCLAILGRTFRGTEAVTRILHECSQKFSSQGADGTAWHFKATVARNVRIATIEAKMVVITDSLKDFKGDVLTKRRTSSLKSFPRTNRG